jgi:Fanconi anemia group D2 protein
MNDMQIIIRKQLSNPQEKYKKIGIIGALSVVKAMGSAEFSRDAAAGSGSCKTRYIAYYGMDTQLTLVFLAEITSSQAVRHPTLQQAVAMLETVLRSCKGYSVGI